jgi:hypothetical protein
VFGTLVYLYDVYAFRGYFAPLLQTGRKKTVLHDRTWRIWFLIRTMDFVKAAHIVFVTDVPNVIASVL